MAWVMQIVPQIGRPACGSDWLWGLYSCKSQSFGTRPAPLPISFASFPTSQPPLALVCS